MKLLQQQIVKDFLITGVVGLAAALLGFPLPDVLILVLFLLTVTALPTVLADHLIRWSLKLPLALLVGAGSAGILWSFHGMTRLLGVYLLIFGMVLAAGVVKDRAHRKRNSK